MRKLKLDLDDLSVESFDTQVQARAVGTVHGHETEVYGCTLYCNTGDGTCPIQSCAVSACVGQQGTCSCLVTWGGSCNNQITCAGGNCGPGHSGGWCSQYCGAGPTFDTCPGYGCAQETIGGC